MGDLPTGIVTFLLSDVEDSTKLWEQHPEAMKLALARYESLMRQAIESAHGQVFKTMGDSFFCVFVKATDAVRGAVSAHQALRAEAWSETGPLPVRMALHTGEADLRDGHYGGGALSRVVRLLTAGSGGQTLLTLPTQELVNASLPVEVELRDLGERRLKDVPTPERIFQIVTKDMSSAPAQPIVCNSCGAVHLPNTLFCDQCGHLLSQTMATDTDALSMPDAPTAGAGSSTALKLTLTTPDSSKQFSCVLTTSLLIGRTDTASGSYPDVDLGSLQGFESGVSRRHARLLRSDQQVLIEDLNSLNGTFVQNVRLHAHHPHVLQPGDELQFGKVVLKITWSS
jgi:class 3 adenylate cyclase